MIGGIMKFAPWQKHIISDLSSVEAHSGVRQHESVREVFPPTIKHCSPHFTTHDHPDCQGPIVRGRTRLR